MFSKSLFPLRCSGCCTPLKPCAFEGNHDVILWFGTYCPLMTGITFAQYHKSKLEAVLNRLQMHVDVGSLSGTLLREEGGDIPLRRLQVE